MRRRFFSSRLALQRPASRELVLLGASAVLIGLLSAGCRTPSSPAKLSEDAVAFTLVTAASTKRDVTHGLVMRGPVKTLRAIELVHHDGRRETGTWTGTPLPALLASLGSPLDTASTVHVRAKDGYERSIPAAALADAVLAWQHNGQKFEEHHDAWGPFRIVIPGRHGEDWIYMLDTVTIQE